MRITGLRIDGTNHEVKFVDSSVVCDGVVCDTYTIGSDKKRDLAVVRVRAGAKTPLQRVTSGDITIERYVGGAGSLLVENLQNQQITYVFPNDGADEVVIAVGEKMQWSADRETELLFYEICMPPYQDGRFENLSM